MSPSAGRHKPAALSERELRFCLEYVREKNGTRAAIAAGYSDDPAVAASLSSRLLRKVQIRRHLDDRFADLRERYALDLGRVLDELAVLALSDVEHVELTQEGGVEVRPGVPPAARRAVRKKSVTVTTTTDVLPDGVVRTRRTVHGAVEMYDKLKALKCLRDHFREADERRERDRPTADASVPLDLLVRLGAILQQGPLETPADGTPCEALQDFRGAATADVSGHCDPGNAELRQDAPLGAGAKGT